MRKLLKYLVLFTVGALVYFEIELNWRYAVGHLPVHWTMAVLGGFLFLLLGGINEKLNWDMPFPYQCFVGTVAVTIAEFAVGFLLNIVLKMDVWDYSGMPLNVMGQICLPFSLVWLVVSAAAIVLDDWLRYWLFQEERPHYRWS